MWFTDACSKGWLWLWRGDLSLSRRVEGSSLQSGLRRLRVLRRGTASILRRSTMLMDHWVDHFKRAGMRIAIVSDIHGNWTAFKAVLADLRLTAPDVIFQGGDLADAGSSPAEVVDRVRELGWPGVVGNTDEMLFRPEALQEFARNSPGLEAMWAVIEEMAAATRELLGEDRLAWLAGLPRSQFYGEMALVHASPESLWRAPSSEA